MMPATTACGEPFPGDADCGPMTVTPDPSADAHDGVALAAPAPPAAPAGALDPPEAPDPAGVPDPPAALDALDPHPATAVITATAAIAPHNASPRCLPISFPPIGAIAASPPESSERS